MTPDHVDSARSVVWHLRGTLDATEIEHLERLLDDVALFGAGSVLLDLAAVTHADFRALRALFGVVEKLERRGLNVRSVNATPYVRDLFRVAYRGLGSGLIPDGRRPAAPVRLADAS